MTAEQGAASRCTDCGNTACALRGGCASVPLRSGYRARLSRWASHPAVRARAAAVAVLLGGLALLPWSHGLGLFGLGLCTLVALWWSAPRASVAAWPSLAIFAAGAGLLVMHGGPAAWIPVAVDLAVGCARWPGRTAFLAWLLCALALCAAALAGGPVPVAMTLVGSGLGAALGGLVALRARLEAREQQLLRDLAAAQARAVVAEARGEGLLPAEGAAQPAVAGVAP